MQEVEGRNHAFLCRSGVELKVEGRVRKVWRWEEEWELGSGVAEAQQSGGEGRYENERAKRTDLDKL